MQIRLFKPLRGWRQLSGEVGIIVLGVLIALGAEQVVQTVNQRREMRELRAAVDNEIGVSIGTYDGRVKQEPCVEARLAELDQWLQSWRGGGPKMLTGTISAPRSAPSRSSVWASRDPAVMSHMPLPVKLAYGSIYDEFANNEVQRLDERMTWLALAEYDGADKLDVASMMRLRGLITRARWRSKNITGNAAYITDLAKQIGIQPQPDYFPASQTAELCRPILQKS